MLVAEVDSKHCKMQAKPKVTTFGIVADRQDKAFAKEMEDILENFLLHVKDGQIENPRALENDLRQIVRKHIFRKNEEISIDCSSCFNIVEHILRQNFE